MPFYTFTKGEAGEGVSEERERERQKQIDQAKYTAGLTLVALGCMLCLRWVLQTIFRPNNKPQRALKPTEPNGMKGNKVGIEKQHELPVAIACIQAYLTCQTHLDTPSIHAIVL